MVKLRYKELLDLKNMWTSVASDFDGTKHSEWLFSLIVTANGVSRAYASPNKKFSVLRDEKKKTL